MRQTITSIAISAFSSEPSDQHLEKALSIIESALDFFGRGKITWFLGGYKGLMKYAVDFLLEKEERVVLILPIEYEMERFPSDVVLVKTGMSFPGRNVIMVRSSDALFSLGGGAGTIMETITALEIGKRVIALIGTGLPSDRLVTAFQGPDFDPRKGGRIYYVDSDVTALKVFREVFSGV